MTVKKTRNNIRFTADEYGAELISVGYKGKEILWNAGDSWKRHAPVLFPFICSPADHKYFADGKEYTMPSNHGFARDSKFTLKSEGDNYAEFLLSSSDETKKLYPYDFRLLARYTIENDSVIVTHTVFNDGEKDMYFYLGGHPAFACDIESGKCVLKYEKPETIVQTLPSFSRTVLENESELNLTRELFDHDVIMKDKPASDSVSLINPDGSYVKLTFPDSDCIAVWTVANDPDAQFICLEPWTSVPVYADDEYPDIEKKPHAKRLPSGGKFIYRYIIEAGESI